jgi:hypothetical protein
MNSKFFKYSKKFFNDKTSFRMLYTNLNSNVFKTNFANKTYFNKIIQLISCNSLIRSDCKQVFSLNSESANEDLLSLSENTLLGNGKFF